MDKVMQDEEIRTFVNQQDALINNLINMLDLAGMSKVIAFKKGKLQINLLRAFSGIVGIQARNGNGRQWAAILPETGSKTAVRIQYWDENGFFGHSVYKTGRKALAELVAEGYLFPDKGSLSRMAVTEKFIEGNRRMDELHRAKSGRAA